MKYSAFPYTIYLKGSWTDISTFLNDQQLFHTIDYLASSGGDGKLWTDDLPRFTLHFASKANALMIKLLWQNA